MRFKTLSLAAGALLMSAGAASAAVVTHDLNLRDGPGTRYRVMDTMPAGAEVAVLDCGGSWCRVDWHGERGYASRNYLSGGRGYAVRRHYYGPGVAVYPGYSYWGPGFVFGGGYYYGHRYYRHDYDRGGYHGGHTVGIGGGAPSGFHGGGGTPSIVGGAGMTGGGGGGHGGGGGTPGITR